MNPFVERYQEDVAGVLSCFDRVMVTGTLPDICHPKAMALAWRSQHQAVRLCAVGRTLA